MLTSISGTSRLFPWLGIGCTVRQLSAWSTVRRNCWRASYCSWCTSAKCRILSVFDRPFFLSPSPIVGKVIGSNKDFFFYGISLALGLVRVIISGCFGGGQPGKEGSL